MYCWLKPSFHFSLTKGLLTQLRNARDLWENLLRYSQGSTEKWGPQLCKAADRTIFLLSFSLLFVVVLLLSLLLLLFTLWRRDCRSYWKFLIISLRSLHLECLWKTGKEAEQEVHRSIWTLRSWEQWRPEEDNDIKSRCIQVSLISRKLLGSAWNRMLENWSRLFHSK